MLRSGRGSCRERGCPCGAWTRRIRLRGQDLEGRRPRRRPEGIYSCMNKNAAPGRCQGRGSSITRQMHAARRNLRVRSAPRISITIQPALLRWGQVSCAPDRAFLRAQTLDELVANDRGCSWAPFNDVRRCDPIAVRQDLPAQAKPGRCRGRARRQVPARVLRAPALPRV
jgi:hypothetical protein